MKHKTFFWFVFLSVFSILHSRAQTNINTYQYWFNNDFSNHTLISINPVSTFILDTNVDTNSLKIGINQLNIRFKDDSNVWSTISSQHFYKLPLYTNSNKLITGYQYWFDHNFLNAVNVEVTNNQQIDLMEAIDANALTIGMHQLNIRFKDDGGLWSTLSSQYFYKLAPYANENRKLTGYEYWFDNDFLNATNVIVANSQEIILIENIDGNALKNGMHKFNIRFKDDSVLWSSFISKAFYKVPSDLSSNKITTYRYWIDDDFANAVYVDVTSPSQLLNLSEDLDFSALTNGDYTLNVQFKDSLGTWSVITSDVFALNTLDILENTFEKSIVFYPNPSKGIVYLNLGQFYENVSAQVFNVSGQRINSYTYSRVKSLDINLNYDAGFYFILIKADEKNATLKVLKQ